MATSEGTGAISTTTTLVIHHLTGPSATLLVPPVYVAVDTRYVLSNASGSVTLGLAPNATVDVVFEEEFLLDLVVAPGGSIGAAPSWVAGGTELVLSANAPSPGYTFSGWEGPYSSSNPTIAINVTGPLTEAALYSMKGTAAASGPKTLLIAGAVLGPTAVGGLLLGWGVPRLLRSKPKSPP